MEMCAERLTHQRARRITTVRATLERPASRRRHRQLLQAVAHPGQRAAAVGQAAQWLRDHLFLAQLTSPRCRNVLRDRCRPHRLLRVDLGSTLRILQTRASKRPWLTSWLRSKESPRLESASEFTIAARSVIAASIAVTGTFPASHASSEVWPKVAVLSRTATSLETSGIA